MKVTMLTTVAGGSAYGSLTSGTTYELPYDYAKSLVDAGSARYTNAVVPYSNPPDTVGPTAAAAVAAAINIVGETLGTEAGLLASMALCNSMGGGEVRLKPGVTYDLTATLPTYTNVTIVGAGWLPAYADIPDAGNTAFGSGSRLRATGAFPIYQYNSGTYNPITHTNTGDLSQIDATALYGTGGAGQHNFSNTAITQSVFRNVCLDGGGVSPYGMIAGAAFKASFFYCDPADNVMFVNFTKDPFRFENFLHINLPKVRVFNCGSLGALGASSSGTGTNYLIPGNSDFNDLLGTIPTSNTLVSRGFQVYARNNTQHNLIKLVRVQFNRFNQQSYSEALTIPAAGNPDIPVADLSKYTEELPFVFSTSSFGLPDVVNSVGGTLYVLSRSGTSGAGTVRFSWQPGIATSLYTPTGAGGAATARTYGFPAIEANGYDTGQVYQLTIGPGSDVESGGTTQVQFSNCADFYCDIKTPNTVSAYTPNITVLSSQQGEIRGNGFPTVYLSKVTGGMTSSGQVRKFGTMGQAVGYTGIGLWKELDSTFKLNLNPAADANSSNTSIPTMALAAGGSWIPKHRGYAGTSLLARNTAAKTLSWNFDVGAIQMDGAGTPALTLPVVDANTAGTFIAIEFVQAGTIATQSGQLINGLGTTTTATIPAGTKVIAWAENNNGAFSWSLLSSDASLNTGKGLRDAANDAAAAALSPPVPVGGLYRNGSVVMVRVA